MDNWDFPALKAYITLIHSQIPVTKIDKHKWRLKIRGTNNITNDKLNQPRIRTCYGAETIF